MQKTAKNIIFQHFAAVLAEYLSRMDIKFNNYCKIFVKILFLNYLQTIRHKNKLF